MPVFVLSSSYVRSRRLPPEHYLTYERAVINYLDLIFSSPKQRLVGGAMGPELREVSWMAFAIPTSPSLGPPGVIRTSFEPRPLGRKLPVIDPYGAHSNFFSAARTTP